MRVSVDCVSFCFELQWNSIFPLPAYGNLALFRAERLFLVSIFYLNFENYSCKGNVAREL